MLATFAVLVFVPIRYVYPSRTTALKWPTLVLGAMWARRFHLDDLAPAGG